MHFGAMKPASRRLYYSASHQYRLTRKFVVHVVRMATPRVAFFVKIAMDFVRVRVGEEGGGGACLIYFHPRRHPSY